MTNNYANVISKKMSDIYIMFCIPRIIFDTKAKTIEVKYLWIDEEAHKCFNLLYEILEIENTALLKQKYEAMNKKINALFEDWT